LDFQAKRKDALSVPEAGLNNLQSENFQFGQGGKVFHQIPRERRSRNQRAA